MPSKVVIDKAQIVFARVQQLSQHTHNKPTIMVTILNPFFPPDTYIENNRKA